MFERHGLSVCFLNTLGVLMLVKVLHLRSVQRDSLSYLLRYLKKIVTRTDIVRLERKWLTLFIHALPRMSREQSFLIQLT